MKRSLPFIIIGAVLILSTATAVYFYRFSGPQESSSMTPSVAPSPLSSPIRTGGFVTFEEFGDYQCPPCGAIHPDIKKIKAEFGDKIKFVFRHFPLTQMHPNARAAAHAAVAAGRQGKFWEMHDLLYENQAVWSELPDIRPIVINFARQIGIDTNQFVKDMDGMEVSATVYEDYQRGLSMGVTGTPTIFLNGQMLETEQTTLENLRQEINRRLQGG